MRDWEEVMALALALPGTEESTSYGRPAVKVHGKAFVYGGAKPEASPLHRRWTRKRC